VQVIEHVEQLQQIKETPSDALTEGRTAFRATHRGSQEAALLFLRLFWGMA